MERPGTMPKECAHEIGLRMELFDQKGVRQVIRVIPDKSKDIGFQGHYLLHHKNPPPLVICENTLQACDLPESLEQHPSRPPPEIKRNRHKTPLSRHGNC